MYLSVLITVEQVTKINSGNYEWLDAPHGLHVHDEIKKPGEALPSQVFQVVTGL